MLPLWKTPVALLRHLQRDSQSNVKKLWGSAYFGGIPPLLALCVDDKQDSNESSSDAGNFDNFILSRKYTSSGHSWGAAQSGSQPNNHRFAVHFDPKVSLLECFSDEDRYCPPKSNKIIFQVVHSRWVGQFKKRGSCYIPENIPSIKFVYSWAAESRHPCHRGIYWKDDEMGQQF